MRDRKARIPLGTPQSKLAREVRPGYHGHWINDTAGRIERAKQAGYEHVRNSLEEGEDGRGNLERAIVGVKEDGSPLEAFLMQIPRKYYEEDQAKLQEPLNEFDRVLRRGNVEGADLKDAENYYVPSEGISVKTG